MQHGKRFLIEEEQRRRVRAAAKQYMRELNQRAGEPGVEAELAEVSRLLDRVGRADTEEESEAIERYEEWLRQRGEGKESA